MDVQVNLWAVLLATASTMVVGSIWYTPKVFGNTWMKLAKLKQKDLEKNGIKPILITVVVSLVTAYVLAHFTYLAHNFYAAEYSFFGTAIITSVWAWLGFTAARIITHDAFEGRPRQLTLLTTMHEGVTFLVMGLIIGAFGI